jgi:hypothetical protein
MDDIDKLIHKYGAKKLISSIVQRVKYPAFFQRSPGKGAPRVSLSELWGLQDVFLQLEAKFPHEKQDSIANRILKFLRDYRTWLKNPDLYSSELARDKDIFDKISWLGNYGKKKVTSKTIVNKLSELRREHKKVAKYVKDVVLDELNFSIYPPGWSDGDNLDHY